MIIGTRVRVKELLSDGQKSLYYNCTGSVLSIEGRYITINVDNRTIGAGAQATTVLFAEDMDILVEPICG